jgi:hypothetical protein
MGLGSGIRDPGSRVNKAPDPESATLVLLHEVSVGFDRKASLPPNSKTAYKKNK